MVKAIKLQTNAQGERYAIVKLTDVERIRIAGGERLTVRLA